MRRRGTGWRAPLRATCALAVAIGGAGACGRKPAPAPAAPVAPLTLAVDLTDIARKIYRVHETVPVSTPALTLVYPKWVPGEHAPSGPVTDVVDLTVSVGGKLIGWTRDPVDMYAFHLELPAGAAAVDVAFDFLGAIPGAGFSSSPSATPHLAVVTWNQLVLYPEGASADQLLVQPRLTVPVGWQYGTALKTTSSQRGDVQFDVVSLSTLVDSPVLASDVFRAIPLDTSARPVEIDLAADSPAALAASPDLVDKARRLVVEADALFGARHFDTYHFLLSASDHVEHSGLEHHQSTDSRVGERAVVDESPALGVLAHEFVHSWNGKFRRPSGLATANFQEPMRGDLLWMYEGLTQYLGYVLAVRSGLWTEQYYRERLAAIAASLDHTPGRTWRPLLDTAVSAQLLYTAPDEWASLRRGTDFYDEGWLIWLGVDTTIREQTVGQRSIDDFCRAFFGGTSGSPTVSPYTLDDVIAALNAVTAFDWRTYLVSRVDQVTAHAPVDGIDRGGWRLVYTAARNDYLKGLEQGERRVVDLGSSIGLRLGTDGTIIDAIEGSAAYQAGLGAGMRVLAVGGKPFSPDVLRAAIAAAARPGPAISLQIDNQGLVTAMPVDYHGGLLEPHLEQVPGHPDRLASILATHARR